MNKVRLIATNLLLTLCCALAGYGFYKMHPEEPWIAGIFGFGVLGVMLSVLRNQKKPE